MYRNTHDIQKERNPEVNLHRISSVNKDLCHPIRGGNYSEMRFIFATFDWIFRSDNFVCET